MTALNCGWTWPYTFSSGIVCNYYLVALSFFVSDLFVMLRGGSLHLGRFPWPQVRLTPETSAVAASVLPTWPPPVEFVTSILTIIVITTDPSS